MNEIVSSNNRWVRLIKKLKDKKHRDSEKMYVIEGPNLIQDAIGNGEDIILIGTDSKRGITDLENTNSEILSFSEDIWMDLTDTVTPQNILAVVRKKDHDMTSGDNRFVILDELQDPGNVGTIIRTAEAAGFTGIIPIKGTADIYSPKVVRSAAGSLFRIGIREACSREDALEFIKEKGITMYACDGNAEASYTDVDLRENIGIVVGNEGNGLSSFFREQSRMISIPMKAETESLNAAVAAGIVIYESVRQRGKQE